MVVEAREQAVETAGLGDEPAPRATEVPGIDDGGAPINVKAEHRSTVPSDGRPHRVRLSRFESKATLSHVAVPELSPCVYTKTVLENKGRVPILAGPVELIRSAGPVGHTTVLFVAPKEQFELGFGAEAELRLKRLERTRDEKSRVLSSWITRDEEVDLTLSNIGAKTRTIERSTTRTRSQRRGRTTRVSSRGP